MTDIKAKVVEFELNKHENADSLSIACIKDTGWQCIVRTVDFENVKLGVYFPIDSELDINRPEFKFLDKNGKPARIKTIRLRGVLSQGLLLVAPEWAKLDDDLTEYYDVKRYEPPIPTSLRGGLVATPSNFKKYTSIDNAKNFKNMFEEGENVRVCEKLHGSSCRVSYIHNGNYTGEFNDIPVLDFVLGSHNTARKLDDDNEYSKIVKKYDINIKLKPIVDKSGARINYIIFGELFGQGIQHLHYDCEKNEKKLRIFDIMIDDVYQPFEYIQKIASELGLETVPLLYRGPFNKEKILSLRDGLTTLGGKHIKEGVVVTAEPERYNSRIGRVILKYISDEYLINQGKKGATDGH
jgi:RNA ligase (TIGR02306 family)